MQERIEKYNFNIGNLFDFNTNKYEVISIDKEEEGQL